jgi:transcriptional regulator with XRE-family HTH domain/KaiC/GvpD/RAD55 family RecA-like ATPase
MDKPARSKEKDPPATRVISVPSGVEHLDRLLNGLYVGDNVVWHDDSGSLAGPFCLNFLRKSEEQKKAIIYVTFDRSPKNLIDKLGPLAGYKKLIILDCFSQGKGSGSDVFLKYYNEHRKDPASRIHLVDSPERADRVMEALYSVHGGLSGDVRLIFESLTGMQELWGSEEAVIRFYAHSCPRLYELNTIAYWILEKGAHSSRLRAQINRIAQVAIELAVKRGTTSLTLLKAEKRELEVQNRPFIYWVKGGVVYFEIEPGVSKRQNIGQRLKKMRRRSGLSQSELARLVGVTPSHVSQVESHQIYPSLSALIKMADVLSVDVSVFFREGESEKERFVFPMAEATKIKPREGLKGEFGIKRLTPVDFKGKAEPYEIEIPPGASLSSHFLSSKGEELGFVSSGEICFEMDEGTHIGKTGDVISLTSSTPRRWWNPGPAIARLLWFIIR